MLPFRSLLGDCLVKDHFSLFARSVTSHVPNVCRMRMQIGGGTHPTMRKFLHGEYPANLNTTLGKVDNRGTSPLPCVIERSKLEEEVRLFDSYISTRSC